MTTKTSDTRSVSYELQIPIQATKEKVWKAMTDETNAWWLPDFRMVGENSVVTFDARAGGSLIETKEDGGSLLWYTVQMCQPKTAIYLVGHIAPDWSGPAISMLKLSLEETDDGCILSISDAIFGHVTDENTACQEKGWNQLFGDGLKAYVEG